MFRELNNRTRALIRRTNHFNHVLSFLRPHRYVINSVLMAQVTHHLIGGIKQLSQVGEEPITPVDTHTLSFFV